MLQILQYPHAHALTILDHLVVPEAKYDEAVPLQVLSSLNLPRIVGIVLTTIKLDDEPVRKADEVDDVLVDWLLPAELKTLKTSTAQEIPHHPLDVGLISSKIASPMRAHP